MVELLSTISRVLFALIVVIGLAYISLRLGKNYMKALIKYKNIKVIETVPLMGKSNISIVKIGEDYMALGITEEKISVLKTLNQDEVAQLLEKENEDERNSQFITVKDWIGKLKHDRRQRKNKLD